MKIPAWITVDNAQQILWCDRCRSVAGPAIYVMTEKAWKKRVTLFIDVHKKHGPIGLYKPRKGKR